MIIVTHIPKTGSSSFLHYLQGFFGPRLFHDHRGPRQAPLFWLLKLLRKVGPPGLNGLARRVLIDDVRVPPGTGCIAGHFLSTKYDRNFPQARHAVWLRDPVERVVSNYHYLRRLADPRNLYCRLIGNRDLTLADFAALPMMRNRQTHFLDDKPLQAFAFVGITEHYPAGLRLAARVFGLPLPEPVPHLNGNPSRRGPVYDIAPDVREHIRRLNLRDERLYRDGRRRFDALCWAFEVDWGQPASCQAAAV